MTNVVTPGLAVTYIRSTGEQEPATISGRSTRGDDFIHLNTGGVGMKLSTILTVSSSQFAAHPHRHQLLMPLMGSDDLQNLLNLLPAHCVPVPCYNNCA